jgi:myo-inositol 2-dehydrogenase/D-chiro-inositol 1-dehydrogenase
MDTVRIGLIGAGVIGAVHSAVLQQIARALPGRVHLVAVADPIEARRSLFADLYGYTHRYVDGYALLEGADIDAVFVCTPTRFHGEFVIAAAERGRHVFCEKPLAMHCHEGRHMVEAVAHAGVRSQIGLVLRYSAVYAVMRDLVRHPQAGQPVAVIFRDDQCFPIRGAHDSPWRADRVYSAGGTLIEHGVHDLDILTWFFGPVARLRAWEHNRAGHPGIEDYMAIELQFASGLRAQLVNVWHNMAQRASNRRLEIFCENAFVASESDMHGDVIVQYGDGPERLISAAEVLDRFVAAHPDAPPPLRDAYGVSYLVQNVAFVTALLGKHAAAPDLAVGLEAQRLAEAAYHAARLSEEVDVTAFTAGAA